MRVGLWDGYATLGGLVAASDIVVRVKVIEADEKGRVRLSMKAAAEDDAATKASPPPAPAEAVTEDAPPIGMAE